MEDRLFCMDCVVNELSNGVGAPREAPDLLGACTDDVDGDSGVFCVVRRPFFPPFCLGLRKTFFFDLGDCGVFCEEEARGDGTEGPVCGTPLGPKLTLKISPPLACCPPVPAEVVGFASAAFSLSPRISPGLCWNDLIGVPSFGVEVLERGGKKEF